MPTLEDWNFLNDHCTLRFKNKIKFLDNETTQDTIIYYVRWLCSHRTCDELRPVAVCEGRHFFKVKFSDNYCIDFKPDSRQEYLEKPFLIKFYLETD